MVRDYSDKETMPLENGSKAYKFIQLEYEILKFYKVDHSPGARDATEYKIRERA